MGTAGARDRAGVRHHPVVRATHWVNVVALTLMVGSGLRIFNAYPAFAPKGGSFCCWPWEGHAIPRWLTFGGWLAGARNWHFAMMWLLALNGAVYLAFIWLHGEWRDLVPRRGDPRDAWQMIRFYLFIRKTHPHQGKHNALQKGVYFILPWLGVLAVLTGLAVWKPVQLHGLTALFGGYAWARYWHFMVMMSIVFLSLGHVFMVFAVDPESLKSMTTGGYDETRSPEALNARPFLRRRPEPAFLAINRHPAAAREADRAADGRASPTAVTASVDEDGDAPQSTSPVPAAVTASVDDDVDAPRSTSPAPAPVGASVDGDAGLPRTPPPASSATSSPGDALAASADEARAAADADGMAVDAPRAADAPRPKDEP